MADRVLLIDDDPLILTALGRLLRKRFDVVTAQGGDGAIAAGGQAMAQGQPFAVAVCDMHMPGMNGLTTLDRILTLSPQTVPIMLTGDADQKTAIDAINQGHIFRFYTKPFDAALLADGIAAAARQSALLTAERRLAENEERWRLALDAVGDGVWDWMPADRHVVFSQSWRHMLGLADGDGPTSLAAWLDRVHGDDLPALRQQLDRLADGQDLILQCEHRLRAADGGYLWFLARGTVLYRADDGGPLRIIGTHTNVTERHLMEETLRRQAHELALLATTDTLTGLWNRRQFLEQAGQTMDQAQRYAWPVSAIMVDIDHFKRVNDTYGHAGGDCVLRAFAATLRGNIRKTDHVGRLGGEEFAVFLPETDVTQAAIVAQTLRRAVAECPVTLDDGTVLRVTASFGVAVARPTDRADSVSDLLNRADAALYQAKHQGRDRVVCQTHTDISETP